MHSEAKRRVVALVLAAGRGTRFGSDKRVARFPNGKTVLETTLQDVASCFDHAYVVVREGDDLVQPSARVTPVVSPRADEGMGASLADGTAYVFQQQDIEALAVVLGDMPWTRPDTYRAVIDASSADAIVVPCFQGQPGHPVSFGRSIWPDLMQLDGDQGARGLLQQHASRIQRLALDDAGIHQDIDEPQNMTGPATSQPPLADQACEACRANTPALATAEQQKLLLSLPGWTLLQDEAPKLQRRYRFDNFRDALAFTNAVGELAEAENHHPRLLTEWGGVTVTWWTHAIAGLHRNDFILAARTDAIATQANLP